MSIVPVGQQGATLDISPNRGPVPVVAGASTGEVVVVPDDGQPSIVPLGGGVSIVPAASVPTFDLDATGQPSGHVPTAQGDDTWAWAAVSVQDTGPRDISSLIVHPGMSASTSPLVLQRVGGIVFLSGPVYVGSGVSLDLGPITAATPEGFRPAGDPTLGTVVPNDLTQAATHTAVLQVWRDYGTYLQSVIFGPTTSGGDWILQATYLTTDPWPDTLPGVPA